MAKATEKEIDQYWEKEYYDLILPLVAGEKKHGELNYLEPEGSTMSRKDNYASINRHTAEAYTGHTVDKESNLHPSLHAACRHMMAYLRWKRKIVHPDDETQV